MSQYYYIVASLPALEIKDGATITTQKFLKSCQDFMSEKDFQVLIKSSISNPDQRNVHKINNEFWEWERSLRNRLVTLRAHKMKINADDYLQEGKDLFEAHHAAVDAYMQESPLHAEHILNNARWNYLENLKTGHYFDLDFLVIYFLQLQILDRISQFDAEKGYNKYQEIYSDIITNVDVDISGEKR